MSMNGEDKGWQLLMKLAANTGLFSSLGFFFFKQKTAYELSVRDWSSDVCSSDLAPQLLFNRNPLPVNTGGDIYVSEQALGGSWGAAVPVPELNTDSSDQHASIAPNGLEIYFHSNRPGSTLDATGTTTSNDIWVSTRESVFGPWSPPTNLGAPINTPADENGAVIFSHGQTQQLVFTRNVAIPPAVDRNSFVSTRTRRGNGP